MDFLTDALKEGIKSDRKFYQAIGLTLTQEADDSVMILDESAGVSLREPRHLPEIIQLLFSEEEQLKICSKMSRIQWTCLCCQKTHASNDIMFSHIVHENLKLKAPASYEELRGLILKAMESGRKEEFDWIFPDENGNRERIIGQIKAVAKVESEIGSKRCIRKKNVLKIFNSVSVQKAFNQNF